VPDVSNEKKILQAIGSTLARRAHDRAVAATQLLDDVFRSYGRIHRTESDLRAGERVLNHERDVLNRLARATGLGFALYLGNRRIATANPPDAPAGAEVGGYADATLVDACLRRRELFRGLTAQHGRHHLVVCRPIFPTEDADTIGPIGMIEAFLDEEAFQEAIVTTAQLESGVASLDESEHASEFAEIMHFIDDVARRLQLLALNGNIIAAQAGEHGSAFRVVCRELGSLATQAKEAGSDVRQLMVAMGLQEAEPDELLAAVGNDAGVDDPADS
jgi:hypothetical protein